MNGSLSVGVSCDNMDPSGRQPQERILPREKSMTESYTEMDRCSNLLLNAYIVSALSVENAIFSQERPMSMLSLEQMTKFSSEMPTIYAPFSRVARDLR